MTSERTGSGPGLPWSEALPPDADVAIVGGGFSGLMTLVHLVRLVPGGRFVVLERRPRALPGPAYGGCDTQHLLNVPAGRMGAFADDPGAFHRWLESTHPGRFGADDFAPRALFGQYLTELVRAELATARGRACLVRDAVVHVERMPAGVELLLASGRSCAAGSLVIAPGLPPARTPWTHVDHGAPRRSLVPDPWEPGSFAGLDPGAEVLVMGSGLTAIDVVQGLRRAGHRGLVRLVSRHGRLPLPHAKPGEPALAVPRERFAGGPLQALRTLRALARERAAAGLGWQGALDAIRPHVTSIWRGWTPAQRRTFLRSARPMWEIHRHRAPRAILEDMERQLESGTLALERGELVELRPGAAGGVRATFRTRAGASFERSAARIFNCIGPGMSVRDTVDPMIGSMLRSGAAVADPLGLGLRTDDAGRIVRTDGGVDDRIHLVGALRRGDLWESTAVPELRVQVEAVARALAGIARMPGGSAGAPHAEGVPEGCG
jgi:uncharacterized NAD(P)/FAD-binding protein YdhS